jgi:hypothetical protein
MVRRLGRRFVPQRFAHGRRAGALAVAALFATVGIATATIPNDGVINACYSRSGGSLRVIDASVTKCGKSETSLAWNVQGVKGDTGAEGPAGPAGPSGTSAGYAAEREDPLEITVATATGQVAVSATAPEGKYVVTVRLRLQTDNAFASAVCSMPGDQVTFGLQQNEPEYVTMTAGVDHGGGPIAVSCSKSTSAHPSFYVVDARLTAIKVDTLN